MKYRVINAISLRAKKGDWIEYEAGQVIEEPPAHLPVKRLLESGDIEELEDG